MTLSNEEPQDMEISIDVFLQKKLKRRSKLICYKSLDRKKTNHSFGLDHYAAAANHCALKSAKVDKPKTFQKAGIERGHCFRVLLIYRLH